MPPESERVRFHPQRTAWCAPLPYQLQDPPGTISRSGKVETKAGPGGVGNEPGDVAELVKSRAKRAAQ